MNSTVGVGSTCRAFAAGAGSEPAPLRPNMSAAPWALGDEPSSPSMNDSSALKAGEHPMRLRSDTRHNVAGSSSAPVANSASVNARATMSVPTRAGAPGGSLPGLRRPSGRPSALEAASKSASQSSPSRLNNRLAGLTSPWTSPASWTRASAAAAAAPTALTSPSASGPRSASTSASEQAALSRTRPPVSAASSATIPGPLRVRRFRASRARLSSEVQVFLNR